VTATAWRPVWQEGVDLEGTWVPLEVLYRLNAAGPSYGQALGKAVGRACELHGLARRARAGGWLAGARLRPFLASLERSPQPQLTGGPS